MTVTLDLFQNVEDATVRKRVELDDKEVQEYLDGKLQYILNHRSVQHPLLNYYCKNAFTKEQEKKLGFWKKSRICASCERVHTQKARGFWTRLILMFYVRVKGFVK